MNVYLSRFQFFLSANSQGSQVTWWKQPLCQQSCLCLYMHTQSLSHVRLFATLWTVARQAPLSMEFSRQEYQSGLPCSPPGHLSDPGIKPMFLTVSCIGRWVLLSAAQEAPCLCLAQLLTDQLLRQLIHNDKAYFCMSGFLIRLICFALIHIKYQVLKISSLYTLGIY